MPGHGLPGDLSGEVADTINAIVTDADIEDHRVVGQVRAREHVVGAGITLKTDASPHAIEQATNEIRVVQLRVKGLDLRSIARSLGWISSTGQPQASRVHETLIRALRRWHEAQDVEACRELELQRLDVVTERVWKIIEKEGGKGDDDRALRAIDRYMQVATRRAMLQGLDAPKQQVFKGEVAVESSTVVQIDMVAAVNEYLSLVDEVVSGEMKRANAIDATSRVTGEEDADDTEETPHDPPDV